MKTREYAFDVKLITSIRIRSGSAVDAVYELQGLLNCVSANLGAFPDGSPIVAEVSMDPDFWPKLYEIDGEPT